MPDLYPILADSSALIGLAACDDQCSDKVFSEVGITTTWTCYCEIRDKARNGQSHWLQKAASKVMDYVKDGEMAYPTRVNIPSAPNAGQYDAGEKSICIALKKHDEFSKVLLFDKGAGVMLDRIQSELSGTPHEFEIEAPNFPLFVLTSRDTNEERISERDFCTQSENILQRMDWKGSRQESLFWKYPIDC